MSAKSSDLKATPTVIQDSRGRPTVQVELQLAGCTGRGDVPAGASKGEDEARTVDVEKAVANINDVILPMLRAADFDFTDHEAFVAAERAIIDRAGENYVTLGANAVLPVSRALWQLIAAVNGKPLHAYIREKEPAVAADGTVAFLMNIFNGGLHAIKSGEELGKDRIDIQEVMVVPIAPTYKEALEMGERIDAALKKLLLVDYAADAITRADEAGFSVKGLGDSTRAIELVMQAMEEAGGTPGKDCKLALDVAASSFFDKASGTYTFRGESISSEQMSQYLVDMVDRYPGKFLSIEDGLDENDWDAWPGLTKALTERDVVTVGDDLFVTQMPRLQRGIDTKAASAILVKVNQNGSVRGTLDVMKHAKDHGIQSIISHRSGETLDDSIADLAVATGALGLKTGDPQPVGDFPDESTWVRRRKYLRMVEIEQGK